MLTTEVLHRAKASRRNFVHFKLDTVKAFDFVSWVFLIQLLRKLGFGPKFVALIEAIHQVATTSIVIQGKESNLVYLCRSLRHGCPLSPLMYIIVASALSILLTREADKGRIRGIFIDETGE